MELKKQQLLVLLTSMFIFTLGFGIVIPVFGYFTKSMGASALDVGLLMATMSAMQFLFAPAWGRVSDRYGRKPVMFIGLFGFSASFIIAGLSTQIWMLFVSQVIGGVLSAGIFPAVMAYVSDVSSHSDRGRLMGFMGAAMGMGIIIGPAISSALTIWGLTAPFFASAGLALVTLAFGLVLLPESLKPGTQRAGVKKKPLLAMLRTPMGTLFFMMLLASFAAACVEGTGAYFIMDKFTLTDAPSQMPVLTGQVTLTGPNVMGIMFTFMGIVSVVSQMGVGSVIQRYGEEKTIVLGLLAMGGGIGLMIVSLDLVTLLLFIGLMSVGTSFINPAVNTLVSKRSSPDQLGATMGLLGSFNSIGRVLGPSVGGLAYVANMALPYAGSSVVAFGCAAVMAFMGKSSKQPDQDSEGTAQ
jgi:MFS family permease